MKYNFLLALLCLIFCSCDDSEGGSSSATFPEFTAQNITVAEADENVLLDIDVNLSTPAQQEIFVTYSTVSATATAGLDFKNISSSQLIFQIGESTKTIQVEIVGDLIIESTEEFYIEFTSGINVSLATKEITVTITDTDTQEIEPGVINPDGYSTPETYAGYTLAWSDEFNGTSLSSDWTHEIGTGNSGWGNNELQYYRSENTTVKDGYLIIQAKKESYMGRQYTSSRIITQGNKSFKYGRIDIRATLPFGQGIWPALWMLGSNFSTVGWPYCGEIDIMEMVGGSNGDNTVYGTLHWDNNGSYACTCDQGNDYSLSSGIFANEFHVFSLIWDNQKIQWYVDDNLFKTVDITPADLSEFQNEFFFIFNVAVGGNWPGNPSASTQFPQQMVVDYVRVFQK